MKILVIFLFFFGFTCVSNRERKVQGETIYIDASTFFENFCNGLIKDYEVDSLKSIRSDTTKLFPLTSLDLFSIDCDKSIKDGIKYSLSRDIYINSEVNSFTEVTIDFCIFEDSIYVTKAYEKLNKIGLNKDNNNFSICQFTWEQESITKYYKKNNILILIKLSGFSKNEADQIIIKSSQFFRD